MRSAVKKTNKIASGTGGLLRVGWDRLAVAVSDEHPDALSCVKGFRCAYDNLLRGKTGYSRAARYVNDTTGLQVEETYYPRYEWLPVGRLTFVADDKKGLWRKEIELVLKHFNVRRLLMAEVAFDFAPESRVDEAFVRKHALFGRARRIPKRHPNILYYGSRRSRKFVRNYFKQRVSAYRVELQLNSGWLRKHEIKNLDDVALVPHLLFERDFSFFEIDWPRLENRFPRNIYCAALLRRLKGNEHDLDLLLRSLRGTLGLTNVRRLLKPLPINGVMESAALNCAARWRRGKR